MRTESYSTARAGASERAGHARMIPVTEKTANPAAQSPMRKASGLLRQRRVEKPTALRQILERGLQFLRIGAREAGGGRQSGRRNRRRGFEPRRPHRLGALVRLGLLGRLILLGRSVHRL